MCIQSEEYKVTVEREYDCVLWTRRFSYELINIGDDTMQGA